LLANEHGDWQDWLAENFDLSIRTAHNYCAAAEYVARKSATVADFANLSPSVLYWLAAGDYDEQEEAAILAATHKGRVDQEAAGGICEELAVEAICEKIDNDDADNADGGGEDSGDDGGGEDADTSAILDGPPPAVPPPAPPPPPTDFALRDFDAAISTLNRLKTKPPPQFAQTTHSADDLESVETFIHAVMKARRQ
jgi:hypothetical protein